MFFVCSIYQDVNDARRQYGLVAVTPVRRFYQLAKRKFRMSIGTLTMPGS
jgi:hypothetical protein